MYEAQRSRGHEGFGFYLPKENKLAHNTREKRILDLLGSEAYQSDEILMHHRFPTSTPNKQNACHPFSTKRNKALFTHNYVLVHNGVVSNSKELKAKHDELGIQYVSIQPDGKFNDSEALLYDVVLYLEGKQDEITAKGSIAFIVKRDDGATFFARNTGSPLVYELTDEKLIIRSVGTGTEVRPNVLYEFLAKTKNFIEKALTIPTRYPAYEGWSGSYQNGNYYAGRRAWDGYDDYSSLGNACATGSTACKPKWEDSEDYDPTYYGLDPEADTPPATSSKLRKRAEAYVKSMGSAEDALDYAQERYSKLANQVIDLETDYANTRSELTLREALRVQDEYEKIQLLIEELWGIYLDELEKGEPYAYQYS